MPESGNGGSNPSPPDKPKELSMEKRLLLAFILMGAVLFTMLGDCSGSSFVARGVALDQRFAAAVCDGGIWDLHERAFLMKRIPPFGAESAEGIGSGTARRLNWPVLITRGEPDRCETCRGANLS